FHDHPPAGMGAAAKSHADQVADGAASAVRADDIAGPDAYPFAVRGEHAQADLTVVLVQRLHVVSEQDLHRGIPPNPGTEHTFALLLKEDVAAGPAELPGGGLD